MDEHEARIRTKIRLLGIESLNETDAWRWDNIKRAEAHKRTRERDEQQERKAKRAAERDRMVDLGEFIDQRIATAIAAQEQLLEALATGCVSFSEAVEKKLASIDDLLKRLDTQFTELRALDDQHKAALDLPSPLLIRKERSVN